MILNKTKYIIMLYDKNNEPMYFTEYGFKPLWLLETFPNHRNIKEFKSEKSARRYCKQHQKSSLYPEFQQYTLTEIQIKEITYTATLPK